MEYNILSNCTLIYDSKTRSFQLITSKTTKNGVKTEEVMTITVDGDNININESFIDLFNYKTKDSLIISHGGNVLGYNN